MFGSAGIASLAQPRNYFGGGAVKISCLRPGSGLGLGFGAFLVSLRPLSLFPMRKRMPQKGRHGKRGIAVDNK